MNRLFWIAASLRLWIASGQTCRAKKRLVCNIRHGKQTSAHLMEKYRAFAAQMMRQERLKIVLRRIGAQHTDCPILNLKNSCGRIVVSEQAKAALSELDVALALEHHRNGDWGLLPPDAWRLSNLFLRSGRGPTLSRHKSFGGQIFFIQTDDDHKTTTVQMKEEFNGTASSNEGVPRALESVTRSKTA